MLKPTMDEDDHDIANFLATLTTTTADVVATTTKKTTSIITMIANIHYHTGTMHTITTAMVIATMTTVMAGVEFVC